MTDIICVRFRTAGKIYYFAVGDMEIKKGMNVIVETFGRPSTATSSESVMVESTTMKYLAYMMISWSN